MSEERQTDNFNAVDQGTRAAQTPEEPVQDVGDAIEILKEQIRTLKARDTKNAEDLAAERRKAQEERSRRERAEASAREAEGRVTQATNFGQRTAEEAKLSEFGTALKARKAQMQSLQERHAAAFTEADGAKMAAINAEMAIVGAQIQALDAGKTQLEGRLAAPQPAPPVIDARQQLMQGMTQRERDWANDHPAYFEDPQFFRKVRAAAQYAQESRGLDRNSDEYFDFINNDLGLSERSTPPKREEQPAGRSADAGAGARMTAAPAGGSVPNAPRETEGAVYLTAGEKEIARIMGQSEAEYAKNKRDLQREGLIGPGARNRG